MRRFAFVIALLLAAGVLSAQGLPPCYVETVAGGGISLRGAGGPGPQADLLRVSDIAKGPDESLYISDTDNHAIWRLLSDGHIELLPRAGELMEPGGLAIAPDGAVYFVEQSQSRIQRLNPDSSLTHIAGNGSQEFSGDGGPATQAGIGGAVGLALGPDGTLYFTGIRHQRVRRVRPDGDIETVAGSGPANINDGFYAGDGGPATQARLNGPTDIAVDEEGVLYIADTDNFRIRRVGLDGVITTVAGNGERGRTQPDGDPLVSGIGSVTNLDIGPDGLLYYLDTLVTRLGTDGRAMWLYGAGGSSGLVVTVDGAYTASFDAVFFRTDGGTTNPIAGGHFDGDFGEDVPAVEVPLVGATDIAVGVSGVLYLAEDLHRARSIGLDGVIRGGAEIRNAKRIVAEGPDGAVFVGGIDGGIHRIDPSGAAVLHAGGGSECDFRCGEGGQSTDNVLMFNLRDFVLDSNGVLYLIHEVPVGGDYRVRMVSTDGILSTPRIDLGTAFAEPVALAIDSEDRVLLMVSAGSRRNQIWRWSPADGSTEMLFDSSGLLDGLAAFAVGSGGSLYMVEMGQDAVWVLTPQGTLDFIAGRREVSSDRTGDRGPALEARFVNVIDLEVSSDGDLYILDGDTIGGRSLVRRITSVVDCSVPGRPLLAPRGMTNGASYSGGLAPGQIVSLFGVKLGPDELATARLENGRLATELAGVRVWVDGVAAPLIFVASGQVSAVIPFGAPIDLRRNEAGTLVADGQVEVVVERDGLVSGPQTLALRASGPGLFTPDSSGQGQAAALNEDGSLNSEENPATAGSVVVLYGTGEGQTDPLGVDGKPAVAPLPRPVLPVRVTIGGQDAEILYAGGAPGFTAGLLQLNVRIPAGATGTVNVVLYVGEEASRAVTIVVAP